MPYAILRFAKKKMGSVSSVYAHNERKKEAYKSNPDIVPKRIPDNYHIVKAHKTYRREIQERIHQAGCKLRKDSTVMVETLITASPEFMNALSKSEQQEYFQRAYNFIADKVGKRNIISATVHMDEKTPHMHLCFTPITVDKRLSAKDILGNQKKLSQWQTDYHNCMSERWPELERGLSSIDTKRKHIPLSLFKAAERLDQQADKIVAALADINPLNAKKKRDSALEILRQWLPQAQGLTIKVKSVDKYVKTLESENRYHKDRNDDLQQTLLSERSGAEEKQWEHYQQTRALQERLRHAEAMLKKIPPEVMQEIQKNQKKRGNDR